MTHCGKFARKAGFINEINSKERGTENEQMDCALLSPPPGIHNSGWWGRREKIPEKNYHVEVGRGRGGDSLPSLPPAIEVWGKVIFSQALSLGPMEGGVCIQGGLGRNPPPSDTTRYGQRADGTHPTGMHSCLEQYSLGILLLSS